MSGSLKTKVRSAETLCVGSAAGCDQRVARDPADVAVVAKLRPAPALGVRLEDRDALAAERFGVERRVVRMARGGAARAARRRASALPPAKRAASTSPLKRDVGEVGPDGVADAGRGASCVSHPQRSRRQRRGLRDDRGRRAAPGTAHRPPCAGRAHCGGRPGRACGSPAPAGPSCRARA